MLEAVLGFVVLVLAILAFAAAGLYFFRLLAPLVTTPWSALRRAAFRWRIRRVSPVAISALRHGATPRVEGVLSRVSSDLVAPLSGRICAYYRVTVEVWLGDRFFTYREILEEEERVDFWLDDGTGSIRVDANSARVVAECDAVYSSGKFSDAHPRLEAFLQRHGKSSKSWLGLNRSLRYRERVLIPTEVVTAVGRVGLRGEELVLGSGPGTPLRITDSLSSE